MDISFIFAFVWSPNVFIPICPPVREIASKSFSFFTRDKREIEIYSLVDKSISISLGSGFFEILLAIFIKSSVVSPGAETTTTTLFPNFFYSVTLFATFFIFSVSAKEDPPNFITIIFSTRFLLLQNLVLILKILV